MIHYITSAEYSNIPLLLVGIPLKDDSKYYEPTVQARQHRGSINSIEGNHHKPEFHIQNMSSMEIGMYVILTVFCFAIIIFVISCVVYASKFRPITIESGLDPRESETKISGAIHKDTRRSRETTMNAHDWVWLGRSTMDRNSVNHEVVTTFEKQKGIKYYVYTGFYYLYVCSLQIQG